MEDVFDTSTFMADDSDQEYSASNNNLLKRLTSKARHSFKFQPTLYLHSSLALVLNLLAVVTSHPLNLLPKELYLGYFLISVIATYRYFYTFRRYEIVEYEELYCRAKGKIVREFKATKESDPYKYYFKILSYLSDKFPGVHFEYKLKQKDQSDYLKTKERSCFTRFIARSWKRLSLNLTRSLFFWRSFPSAGDRFVAASEAEYYKLLRAEFWQHDDQRWVYFMYLNVPIMITLFYGGYHMIFIDFLFIFLVSNIVRFNVSISLLV